MALPKISWNKKQKQKLNEAVKAFNKNLRRIKRRKDIGSQITLKSINRFDIRKTIHSSKDLSRVLKQLNEFSDIKGKPKMYTNKQGVTMLDWQRRKINSDIRIENNLRKKEQKKLENVTVYDYSGNPIPNAVVEQSKYENKPIGTTAENVSSKEALKLLEKRIYRIQFNRDPEKQLKQLAESLKKALDVNLPDERGERLKNIIDNMSYDDLEQMYIDNENSINNGDTFNYTIYQNPEADTAYYNLMTEIFSPYEK